MMLVTGLLTAGVALAVYLYMLRVRSVEVARTDAFAVLVLRAEGVISFSPTTICWHR